MSESFWIVTESNRNGLPARQDQGGPNGWEIWNLGSRQRSNQTSRVMTLLDSWLI
ncbi:hypothetical protein chiPu_0024938, partial [Chiloscyllium punctatum]|nr:hypothetical protein [Chiloscyllium punctatum]